jgi:hypothetical protein
MRIPTFKITLSFRAFVGIDIIFHIEVAILSSPNPWVLSVPVKVTFEVLVAASMIALMMAAATPVPNYIAQQPRRQSSS